jgi:hypothetical protein
MFFAPSLTSFGVAFFGSAFGFTFGFPAFSGLEFAPSLLPLPFFLHQPF